MKSKRNPKPTEDDICSVCHTPYAHTHEVFFGTANRRISIEYGFQEKLCAFHHQHWENAPHVKPYKNDIDTPDAWFDKGLKQKHQARFEETHSREEFMQLIGRNYLD